MTAASWCTIMVSCARRERVRAQTLVSLAASDWAQAPTLVIDNEQCEPTVARIRCTWMRALELGADCRADWVLLLEDDLVFVPNFRAQLEGWLARRSRGTFELPSFFFGTVHDTLPSFFPGTTIPYNLFWGLQAVVTTPATLGAILERLSHPIAFRPPHIDEEIARVIGEVTTIQVMRPGLVRHVGVSTWRLTG